MANFNDLFLSRRQVLRLGALSLAGHYFVPLVTPSRVSAQSRVQPRGSARFCIFFSLTGGPSHIDGWDLKEAKWTPQDFDIRAHPVAGKWPYALYPRLAESFDHLALVRSMAAWESVHERGQYYVQAAHQLNQALWKEIPPVGAVVAAEYQKRRKPNDSFPPYVAFNTAENQAGLLGSGFLPATYSPFHLKTDTSLDAFAPPEAERAQFQERWEFLKSFDSTLRQDDSLASKTYRDFNDHYEGAISLMSDTRTAKVLALSPEDRVRYGSSTTGDAAILARNLVRADAGTHFMFLSQEGWDHHVGIFDPKTPRNHYANSRELDSALGALLKDLASERRPDGRSLLDETLVIAMGEFGRSVGDLNFGRGRDHHQYAFSALFAGGGVKGDRVIGKTDDAGNKVIEPGWSASRSVYMEDVATTIYSAMGIDWTTKIAATPSGRTFHYVEPTSSTTIFGNKEIAELFG
jgi:hypothetical protein